jgi:hypothetical protein
VPEGRGEACPVARDPHGPTLAGEVGAAIVPWAKSQARKVGTLNDWDIDTEPVDLETTDGGTQPRLFGRAFARAV